MTSADTDRIAVSSELFELAERFLIESTMFSEPQAKLNCERAARHLSVLARQALTTPDLRVAQAFADEAVNLLGKIEGARRFLQSISTVPLVRHRHPQCDVCGRRHQPPGVAGVCDR